MPTVLITGGTAGIGLVAAQTFANRFHANLILAGRNPHKVEAAAAQIRATTNVRVDTLALNLDSLASVRKAAAACKAILTTHLDALVLNAGAQFQGPPTFSEDGFEQTFAGNCLGHFLLANLLLDTVAPTGRVVWTASGTHDPALMDGKAVGAAAEPDAFFLANQGKAGKPITAGQRYSTSKLADILYAYELDRRLRSAGSEIASLAYDPGFIPDTGMGRMAPALFRTAPVKFLLKTVGFTMGQMPFSGEALATLACDPAFAQAAGKYFHSKNGTLSETRSSVVSYDQAKAAKLWQDSATLVNLTPAEQPTTFQELQTA